MPAVDLIPANRADTHAVLAGGGWVIACLCAAWCDVCTEFRDGFDRLAAAHPDKLLLWIDIEDEADVVGDFDIENFPTLLIQQGGRVRFFGTVEPDAGKVDRLVGASIRAASDQPAAAAAGAADLLARLAAALHA